MREHIRSLFFKNISLGSQARKDFTRDDDALDLSSAFVNLIDFGSSYQFFHWVLGVEAIATKNLNFKSKREK